MIEMIHIKDVLKSGLFASINYTIPDFTFDELDMLFNMKYGERIISPSVKALLNDENVLTPENMQLLGKIIFNMFHSQWDSQSTILSYNIEPYMNYYEIVESARKTKGNANINTDNSVYAYDSVEASDKDKSTQQSLNEGTDDTKIEKKGFTSQNQFDIMDNALRVKAIKLLDIVFNDIKWFVSLDLYCV